MTPSPSPSRASSEQLFDGGSVTTSTETTETVLDGGGVIVDGP